VIHSFENALKVILQHTPLLEKEMVDLDCLVGRVVAEDILAPWAMPRWNNSEMDGFAVRATDCQPLATLKVTAYIPAGVDATGISVSPGTAVRIMTGAPIPTGCDAIIPIENTNVDGKRVTIKQTVRSGEYIRFRGSDIAANETMIPRGTQLRPADINLLASFCRLQLPVYRRPRVAILSTGDELIAPGEIPASGQIIDSNSHSLAAAVKEIGAIPQLLGIAADNSTSLRKKIIQGLKADVLLTSAGVSTGDRDLVREVLESLGVKQLFWKVAIKPGGPTAFGLKDEKTVFSLPGNPVSSMIGFDQLIRPALLKMMGSCDLIRPLHHAQVKGSLYNKTGKTRFLRVKVEKTVTGLVAESAGNQNTGILSTMIKANAIAILAPGQTELLSGDRVKVQLI